MGLANHPAFKDRIGVNNRIYSVAVKNGRDHTISGSQMQALVECSGSQKLELPWHLSRITSSVSREVWSRELAGHQTGPWQK